MASTFYGIVNEDGSIENAGSGNWSSELRDDTDGLYKVTLNGGSSEPVPMVSVASNNLSSYGTGKECFINVTDVGTDDNGRYYFGVAINSSSRSLEASSFTFSAD